MSADNVRDATGVAGELMQAALKGRNTPDGVTLIVHYTRANCVGLAAIGPDGGPVPQEIIAAICASVATNICGSPEERVTLVDGRRIPAAKGPPS